MYLQQFVKSIRILKNHKVIETKFKNFIKTINDKNYQFKCYKLKVKKILSETYPAYKEHGANFKTNQERSNFVIKELTK